MAARPRVWMQPLLGIGGIVALIGLALGLYRFGLYIEGERAFAGYQVAHLGPLLAVASVLLLVGALIDRPWVVVGSGLAIVAIASLFLVLPDLVFEETWRGNSGGLECMPPCYTPAVGSGPFVALAGGILGLACGRLY